MQKKTSVQKLVDGFGTKELVIGSLFIATLLVGGLFVLSRIYLRLSDAAVSSSVVTLSTESKNDIVNEEDGTLTFSKEVLSASYIGSGKSANTYLAFRFKNTATLTASNISSATIDIVSPVDSWINISNDIYLEKSLTPTVYSTSSKPSQRVLTTAKATFSNNVKWTKDKKYSIDITAPLKELLAVGNPTYLNVIIKNTANQPWARKFFYSSFNDKNTIPVLTVNLINSNTSPTNTSTPTATATATPTSEITTAPTASASVTPVPSGEAGKYPDSKAMGKWTPNPKYDTCSKELHDSYFVVGPDGKKYPTWHPVVTVDPKTGKQCSFGHEHGLDPSKSVFWQAIKEMNYYDENKNGKMDPSEEALAGLPFGLVNESMDAWYAASGKTTMRHEDHVGHKVSYKNESSPWYNNPNTPVRDYLGVRCAYFMKLHQGVHSKDAFSNNLHEVNYMTRCDNGYEIRTTFMGQFGAAGEFSTGLPCEPRGIRTVIGFGNTDPNYPGQTNQGGREIMTYECAKQKLLVPKDQYSGSPYELWFLPAGPRIVTDSKKTLVDDMPIGFAVFDPIRMYAPGLPNDVKFTQELCDEVEPNGDRARGIFCENSHKIGKLSPDDPRAEFKGLHRDNYAKITNLYNKNGPNLWYCDPFGTNCKTSPFVGSVKQYLAKMDVNWTRQYTPNNYPIDPDAFGGDYNYDPSGKVHLPN